MDESADPLELIKALNKQPFKTWSPHGFYTINCYELDKIPGWWVVTHWPPNHEGVVLRLKVRHPSMEEPDFCAFECELRLKQDDEFEEIGSGCRLWLYDIGHPDHPAETGTQIRLAHDRILRETYLGFPLGWRSEFWQMARRLSVLLPYIDFASTHVARYAGEPTTSRDFQQMLHRLLDLESEIRDLRAGGSQDEAAAGGSESETR